MNEQLIAGYTAYTTSEEFGGASSVGEAPASTPTMTISFTAITGGAAASLWWDC
ncbi:LxmA leader domain family RiPP [Streptomyces sp. NPDC006385]|uniref:LxmA leader domain family RiPP n=1 Tax=Streptomyces sp. NPDC006385 TaxID=3156761 RepID=UPI0033BB6B77